MKNILIIGGGIFGLSSAYALTERGHKVVVVDQGTIPHPLASSTDISKAVRLEYGQDVLYSKLTYKSISKWKTWNEVFDKNNYVETGYLMLLNGTLNDGLHTFEASSKKSLSHLGFELNHLVDEAFEEAFPILKDSGFNEAVFNPLGGYVKAQSAVQSLYTHLKFRGVEFILNNPLLSLSEKEGDLAFHFKKELTKSFDAYVLACGSMTPHLVPSLSSCMRITSHAIFGLLPKDPSAYSAANLPVFSADITNTGWYGFPFSKSNDCLKIAMHSNGKEIHPDDERKINPTDISALEQFLQNYFPSLLDARLVYTHRCLYTDTLDGHFWIDAHPKHPNLYICSGGSGHGFKMAPMIGDLLADLVEDKTNNYLDRFKWRQLNYLTESEEEARHKI